MLSDIRSLAEHFEKVVPFLWKSTDERADFFAEVKYKTQRVQRLKWRPVETQERCVFLTYVFLMGLSKLPDLSDCWSANVFCSGPKVFYSKIMSRNIDSNLFFLILAVFISCSL